MNYKFENALTDWSATARKLADYGAYDGEPRSVMMELVSKKINHDENYLPLSADKWELYSSKPGAEAAATKLNEATQKILDIIDSLKYNEVKEIVEYYDL